MSRRCGGSGSRWPAYWGPRPSARRPRPGGWGSRASIATWMNFWPMVEWAWSMSPRRMSTTLNKRAGSWNQADTRFARSPCRRPRMKPRGSEPWPDHDRPRRPRSTTISAIIRFATKSARGSPADRWAVCSASRAHTSRTGCCIRRITTGESSPTAAQTSAPWPTSARIGWTWPSFLIL